ncbi:hypothetical protein P5673_031656 [Acropora cervicornis]|uniref:Uncharacterized protein n=1 Tax=Acropora cervicornis TaxID=6130 RepID=A0AAD9USE4_ACRCE|nr:hypothetical protein P5673_031656 [Acropora cervicornis]
MAKSGQSDQMKSLRRSNNSLKKPLENARKDIKRLEERVEVQEHASKEHNGGPSHEVQLETERSLSWLHESKSDIQSELRAIRKRLDDTEEGLGELEGAVEEFQDYSYFFNIKILGVPELSDREKAEDTSNLCVNLFNKMGAEVSMRDIDITHRVSLRDTSRMGPKPIVCKFVRRLARNKVMSKRKEGRSVDLSTISLHEGSDMSTVLLLDHLTPRLQQLYSDAKEFKLKYGYQFCWARNGSIFLCYSADEGSKLLKVRTSGDLPRYAQDEQGQLS